MKLSQRQIILKEILSQAKLSTQDELVNELSRRKFKVTQSTISRDLRRIGAVKNINSKGHPVYSLANPNDELSSNNELGNINLDESIYLKQGAQLFRKMDFKNQVRSIKHNGHLIVIETLPGSASLVARYIDTLKEKGFLGTIAGDDTIFLAPQNPKNIKKLISFLENTIL